MARARAEFRIIRGAGHRAVFLVAPYEAVRQHRIIRTPVDPEHILFAIDDDDFVGAAETREHLLGRITDSNLVGFAPDRYDAREITENRLLAVASQRISSPFGSNNLPDFIRLLRDPNIVLARRHPFALQTGPHGGLQGIQ